MIYADILSDILSGIYSGIYSGILSDILADMGAAGPQPRVPDLSRRCPLRSSTRSWDPRLPEEKEEKATLIKPGDNHLGELKLATENKMLRNVCSFSSEFWLFPVQASRVGRKALSGHMQGRGEHTC